VSGLKLNTGVLVLALAPLFLGLSGCHLIRGKISENACNKPQPYQTQRSDPPLQIPPGFDTPDASNQLKLPALNQPAAPPRTTHEPCLDAPPPYKVPKPPPPPQA
jgi:uncharacterized lipoprotein